MDTVFYVVKDGVQIYMLTDWGQLTMDDVKTWVTVLKETGVPKGDGTNLPVCDFDNDNLIWSGAAIKNSITVKLWDEIETDLEYGATGPEILVAIFNRFQHSSSSAARALISKLQELRLVREPGMNVDNFSVKVSDIVQCLEGNHRTSIPDDLSTLVAQCYLDTDVDEFKLAASALFNHVDVNPKAVTWRQIIQELKNKYCSLEGLNHWPHKSKRSQAEEITALKGTINTLQQKVNGFEKAKTHGGGTGNRRTCFQC